MPKLIIIEKLIPSPNPAAPTPCWNDYKIGSNNEGVSIPTGYVIEGYLLEGIVVGRSVRVLRTKRNGVAVLGVFTSSPVTAVSNNLFATENSVYRYTYSEHTQPSTF